MTIAGFIGIYTASASVSPRLASPKITWLVIGVFLAQPRGGCCSAGSPPGWAKKIPDGGLHAINIGTGLAIVLIGLWQLGMFALKNCVRILQSIVLVLVIFLVLGSSSKNEND